MLRQLTGLIHSHKPAIPMVSPHCNQKTHVNTDYLHEGNYNCGQITLFPFDFASRQEQPKAIRKSRETANVQQEQQIIEVSVRSNFKSKPSACFQNRRGPCQRHLFSAVLFIMESKQQRFIGNHNECTHFDYECTFEDCKTRLFNSSKMPSEKKGHLVHNIRDAGE